jgi:hypothetical protein
MDDLTRYVITHYGGLMTPTEFQAWRSVMGLQKMDRSTSPPMKEMLARVLVSNDPEVLELLADGHDVFLTGVRERILREHADKVFLNQCPECGGLAWTPRARQCPHCFHSWHDQPRHGDPIPEGTHNSAAPSRS